MSNKNIWNLIFTDIVQHVQIELQNIYNPIELQNIYIKPTKLLDRQIK